MEDTAIIDLYWKRDEQAIVETDLKYGKYCHTVAYNVLNDVEDSRECVNDTWLRAWNSMPPKRPSVLRAFLAKITRNLAFDRYRARSAAKRGYGIGEIDAVDIIDVIFHYLSRFQMYKCRTALGVAEHGEASQKGRHKYFFHT